MMGVENELLSNINVSGEGALEDTKLERKERVGTGRKKLAS